MPRVYLGDDPFIPGRRIEVEASGLDHGDDCRICRAVRLAQVRVTARDDLPPEYSRQTLIEAFRVDELARDGADGVESGPRRSAC